MLRWGFDRTQLKLITGRPRDARLLVPPWKDLPLTLGDELSGPYSDPARPKDPRMLFAMGAWLARSAAQRAAITAAAARAAGGGIRPLYELFC